MLTKLIFAAKPDESTARLNKFLNGDTRLRKKTYFGQAYSQLSAISMANSWKPLGKE
jgi:hypothetical protein